MVGENASRFADGLELQSWTVALSGVLRGADGLNNRRLVEEGASLRPE